MRPGEQRKPEPGHPRRTHGMDGDDEVEAGENRGEAVDKDADDRGRDGGIGVDAAKRGVKGPAGIQPAGAEGIQNEAAANHVDIPAEKIDLREGQILRADHQGNQKIAEDGGNRGNQEKEDHGHAMHGEELVVRFRRNQGAGWRQKMDTDHGGEEPANEKEKGDGTKPQQSDALVVGGEEPRTEAILGVQVILVRHVMARQRILQRVAHDLFLPRRRRNPGALRGNR